MSSKRIAKEFGQCSANPPPGISVALATESDLHQWHVTIQGPPNSVYAGGQFGIVLVLPKEYPFKAPVVTFATRIYHPNVTNDNLGNVCLAMLKAENWKPVTPLSSVLEAVRALLIEPQPDDPLETRIAEEYRQQRAEFDKQARMYVAKYAKGPPTFP
ncbi:Ubiquitin-conjugating enzyme/RWD-like protein [Niveomyces insectorum RCEF 264]|uniref:E2 ubiquitin-conjugating enzyme n=1 Tax=Niveomyces insectorum RCEF 264 TaxID=1081102 RepID=A0A167XYX5_9HYPO|nr:Ubiquitin-conjugating enzyme/RWD-like protein [Niveomyces insectorum RCEF 264]